MDNQSSPYRSNNHHPPRPSAGRLKCIQMLTDYQDLFPEELHALGAGKVRVGQIVRCDPIIAKVLTGSNAARYVPKSEWKKTLASKGKKS